MKNALFLHGTGGHSQVNWFLWVSKHLESEGWKTWVPDLPISVEPNVQRYNEHIFENKDWKFDEESVLVGHSSGAVQVLRVLEALPENVHVDTCYMVGIFKDDLGWEALKEFMSQPFDFDLIKTKAKKFVFIHSDDDPYCPLDHVKYFHKHLGGELIIQPGQKHFSTGSYGDKYTKFPFLLDHILKNHV